MSVAMQLARVVTFAFDPYVTVKSPFNPFPALVPPVVLEAVGRPRTSSVQKCSPTRPRAAERPGSRAYHVVRVPDSQ